MGRLDRRVAIVTGASRGLGRSIAVLFADEGAAVAVVARTEAQWDPRLPGTVHDTVAAIEAAGGRAVAVPADLAQPDEVEGIVERASAELGTVDILVNNAALTVPGRPPKREPGGPGAGPVRPGNLYAGAGDIDYASPERFAEATLQVALADATVTTGQLLWSEDVLEPELGQRGWLSGR